MILRTANSWQPLSSSGHVFRSAVKAGPGGVEALPPDENAVGVEDIAEVFGEVSRIV